MSYLFGIGVTGSSEPPGMGACIGTQVLCNSIDNTPPIPPGENKVSTVLQLYDPMTILAANKLIEHMIQNLA